MSQIDYNKATNEFGAKSVESMRVCTNAALKKIENAGGKTGASATTSATTSATPKKGGGRKRKATPEEDGDDEEQAPSTTKKKGRKSKKNIETPADCELSFGALPQLLRLICLQLLLRTMKLSRASLPPRARRTLLLGSSLLDDERHTSD